MVESRGNVCRGIVNGKGGKYMVTDDLTGWWAQNAVYRSCIIEMYT